FGDAMVKPRAPRLREAVIQDALVQIMEKGVGAVSRFFDEDAAACQARTIVVNIIRCALEGCGNGIRSKDPSCHAGRFKQTLIVGRQSLKLTIDQLLQSFGHTHGCLPCVTTQMPRAIRALEKSATDEVIGDVHHEQGIAVSALMYRRGQATK